MPAMYINDDSSVAVISSLTTKIVEGSELTQDDLQAADALLKNPNDCSVPTLDRLFLERWSTMATMSTTTTSQQPQLVRHFGMVQDMLEPEYYVANVGGKSTHFRDTPLDCGNGGDVGFNPSNLAERVPHMIVPVPFASKWFVEQQQQQQSNNKVAAENINHNDYNNIDTSMTTSTKIPESPEEVVVMETTTTNRKRERDFGEHNNNNNNDDDDDLPYAEVMCSAFSRPRTEDDMDCDLPPEPRPQGQELDWWPSGCMGSAPDQCPILAKLYYDQSNIHNENDADMSDSNNGQSSRQRKLRLNDLVEVVGILSMDPWEADFSNGDNDDFFGTTPPPPPSRLPRLHVLSYQITDLDTVAASWQHHHNAKNNQNKNEQEVLVDHDEQPSVTLFSPPNSSTSNTTPLLEACQSIVKDPVVAEALCMTLLSKAQREHQKPDGPMQRAAEHAIGCLSLQLYTDGGNSKQVFQQLATLLRTVCPVLATVDLSSSSKVSTNTKFGSSSEPGPAKLQGRLNPTPWQLPRGATILVHNNFAGETACSVATRELLAELLSQHRIPYTFDGGMKVPFDADFRMIVVTNNGGSSTSSFAKLQCSMNMTLSKDGLGLSLSSSSSSSSSPSSLLQTFRTALTECRACQSVGFSDPIVLEVAQKDFLEQRRLSRKESTTTRAQEEAPAVPQEADFHRWLTVTRLQARSRQSTSANVGDWERALALDLNVVGGGDKKKSGQK